MPIKLASDLACTKGRNKYFDTMIIPVSDVRFRSVLVE